ncbi:hypothetical protein DYQ86_27585, partial [Acidobacteria bacterium AB60]
MLRKLIASGMLFASCGLASFAADQAAPSAKLTAAQIVEKNVAARGGLQAWRAVQSLKETGKMAAGGNDRATQPVEVPGARRPGKSMPLPSNPRLKEEAQLPFTLELERPRKLRLEIEFAGKTAVQIYDGSNGWKVRPFLNRNEVEPYTEDELKLAAMQTELDGPLVDYAAKGNKVELEGTEKVENRDTYKLKVTLANGHETHVWVDAQTFLEAKVEGQPRRMDGKMHPVEIYYRDYRAVNGLQIPFELETHVVPLGSGAAAAREQHYQPEKIAIDKIVVNPKLNASDFTKPQLQVAA